jgi:hypothetical protein
MTKRSVQLIIGILTNAAGVQNNNISLIVGLDALHAVSFK